MEDPAIEVTTDTDIVDQDLAEKLNQASAPYLGAWNTLISTTNWDKGKIILSWRNSLVEAGAPASEYADDAWAQRVKGVTGQHVGRLRRVAERFADNYRNYEGLFWSHFQAAIEWEDAEMWLEGAVQNGWSVASMRNQRWETMGKVEADRPSEKDVVASDVDEDYQEPAQGEHIEGSFAELDPPNGPLHEGPDFGDENANAQARENYAGDESEGDAATPANLIKPFAEIGALPDDVMDAFESFKLAIIRLRAENWQEFSRDDMLSCIESLKVLVNAPSGEKPQTDNQTAPF